MGCYNERCLVQRSYDVTLAYNCNIKANSEKEAKEKAMTYYRSNNYPISSITVKEIKKVKKIIHYSAQNYYTQEVWVDEDMDEDEIMDLWGGNQIEILNEPKIDDTRVNDIVSDIWVE